jgi:hypothetical protein
MFFMILLPRQDPIFGFEGLSKTVDTLSWRNNYVTKTTPMDSESKSFTTTRCIYQLVPFILANTPKNKNTARTT